MKGGLVHGATDDFGFKAVENAEPVHDLYATIVRRSAGGAGSMFFCSRRATMNASIGLATRA